MRRIIAVVLPVFILSALLASVCSSAIPASAAQPTDTPTPTATLDPLQPTATATQPAPSATPKNPDPTATPWVVILITATPDKRPPSWQIPDLDKKIKKTGAIGPHLRLALAPAPARFDSPVPVEIDDQIVIFMDWLVQREREYFEFSGQKYAQMLPSHYALPDSGVHQYPDAWFNHPTDQQYAWPDLNAIQFEPMPISIYIDAYSGPEGAGFVSCFTLAISGQPWRRCVNYGPEALRNSAWALVDEASP